MTSERVYIDPEAAAEVWAAMEEYQVAQQQANIAKAHFERTANVAAVGVGIKRGTKRQLTQDEQGRTYFAVEVTPEAEAAIEAAEEKREKKKEKRKKGDPVAEMNASVVEGVTD